GRFELDDAGIEARDALVIAECRRRDVPVACVIGGGYDRDHLVLARRHSILHRVASRFAV
ncbi:MAG TPA: histone deacetylase, partial [Calditrichia bacterium]|nr:histone deacetylase [Calditrichia bacterium]